MTAPPDLVVMVDWSAAGVPARGRDSIWQATLDCDSGQLDVVNHPTRNAAYHALRSSLIAAAGRRALVGFDFPFGYPRGFAASLALNGWRDVWRELTTMIRDDERNRNNRYEVAALLNRRLGAAPGPFWGCPGGVESADLPVRKPAMRLPEYRHTEALLRASGRRPFSVWQTCYAGSVGGQALTGLPVLERLVSDERLRSRIEVWPFTTGFVPDPTSGRRDAIVLAEVWPSALDVDRSTHPVKDAAQVIAAVRWAAATDLSRHFAPPLPCDVAADAVAEEGWVLT